MNNAVTATSYYFQARLHSGFDAAVHKRLKHSRQVPASHTGLKIIDGRVTANLISHEKKEPSAESSFFLNL